MKLALIVLLAVASAAEQFLVYQGADFSLQYPKKSSKILPSSAVAPFSVEYRKKSLLRVEVENLLQPIDLSDSGLARIFLEIQAERLRERVPAAELASQQIRSYPWGTGAEFVYYSPSREKSTEKQKVVEILTTYGSKLYRLTYWIPEREIGKTEPVLQQVVSSLKLGAPAAAAGTRPPSRGAGSPAISPADLTAQGRRAYLRFSGSGMSEAVEAYRRVIAAPDAPALAHAGLAEALGWKGYLEGEVSPAELEQMRRAAERAGELAPDRKETYRAQAYAAYHASQMMDMEAAIHEALRRDPGDAESYLLQALWYGFNPKKAQELANEALRRNPRLVGAYLVKARAALKEGDDLEATSALRRALALEPELVEAHLALGELAEERGDRAGALEAYQAAVRADLEDVEGRFRLAVAYRRAGRPDEAIAEYGHALRLAPNLPEAHYNLALLYFQDKSDPGRAAEHFKRFLELDPGNEKAEQVSSWLRARGYR